MKVLTKFLLSAYAPEQFPPAELPEIAFLGRSNVGKSSLINSLVSAKIAKTSNTPGRTQAINFFEIRWPGRPQSRTHLCRSSRLRLRPRSARDLPHMAGVHRALPC